MLQRIRKARHEESGFTLIELLIVIVILGILAAVVVFAVNGIQARGTAAACKSDVASVTTAAEAAYAQTGTYPATMAALVTAGFLHSVPSANNGYVITYTVAAGPPASVTVGGGTVC
jgi:prepilin-type N-terminal cleavage/methylation domain-containing protein